MIEPKFNHKNIIDTAAALLMEEPVHLTDSLSPLSPGTTHDYYSNGDYWWPDPDQPDGLPYIQIDGRTNPDNFIAHRLILRKMRLAVTHLAAAYHITGKNEYAKAAEKWLKEFFLDSETIMNPHLSYAQAIPGICTGRGIGIIDTLHLIDVPQAIEVIKDTLDLNIYNGLQTWFSNYLKWMNTHPNGIEERDWHNNHSVTWFAQASSYARFTHNDEMLEFCRKRYKEVLLPGQMALDGSFPYELKRTKPYNYSCIVLDNMVNICLLASTEEDNLWDFTLSDGRSIKKALDYLFPYLEDKSKWPVQKDVEHYEEWPLAMPFMAFSALYLQDDRFLKLWNTLNHNVENEEILRNIAIRCPYLFTIKIGENNELFHL